MNTDKATIFDSLLDGRNPLTLGELNPISERIIGCAFTVSNSLGAGFLEKVYENALAHEMRKHGLKVSQQATITVIYDGIEVGRYDADLLVEEKIIVELKAVREMNDIFRAQCINYLRATGLWMCLLINFGNPKVEVKRIVI